LRLCWTGSAALRANDVKHIDALKAFAGAGAMTAAALSILGPALAGALNATPISLEATGSLIAALGVALWVETPPARP
jgi:hypothetical protein